MSSTTTTTATNQKCFNPSLVPSAAKAFAYFFFFFRFARFKNFHKLQGTIKSLIISAWQFLKTASTILSDLFRTKWLFILSYVFAERIVALESRLLKLSLYLSTTTCSFFGIEKNDGCLKWKKTFFSIISRIDLNIFCIKYNKCIELYLKWNPTIFVWFCDTTFFHLTWRNVHFLFLRFSFVYNRFLCSRKKARVYYNLDNTYMRARWTVCTPFSQARLTVRWISKTVEWSVLEDFQGGKPFFVFDFAINESLLSLWISFL